MDANSVLSEHVDVADKIADAQSAANSPHLLAEQFPDDVISKFRNDEEGGSNAASEDDLEDGDSDMDAMYGDGNETTAPGHVAQVHSEQPLPTGHLDHITPDLREDHDDPDGAVRDVSMSMVAQPSAVNPLLDDSKLMRNGQNIYHPNRHVNKMMAQEAERGRLQSGRMGVMAQHKKLQEQSLSDWCYVPS